MRRIMGIEFPPTQDALLTAKGAMRVRDTIEFSGIGKTKLYALMENGELAYIRCGGRRLIERATLERFLSDRLVAAK